MKQTSEWAEISKGYPGNSSTKLWAPHLPQDHQLGWLGREIGTGVQPDKSGAGWVWCW